MAVQGLGQGGGGGQSEILQMLMEAMEAAKKTEGGDSKGEQSQGTPGVPQGESIFNKKQQ